MSRRCLAIVLTVGLLAQALFLFAQSDALDPDVAKGVKLVEEGDYDAAILVLDAVARGLATRPGRSRQLPEAYLYLGIAYLGKGHESLAKARFRDALAQGAELNLSPEKFAPRVLELLEKAREELGRSAPAPAPAPTPTATPAPPEKKGGSKKGLVLLGVGGVGAAVAVAATSGGEEGAAGDGRTTDTFRDRLTLAQGVREYTITIRGNGVLEANISWTEAAAYLHLYLRVGNPRMNAGNGTRTGNTSENLTATVAPGDYVLGVIHNRPEFNPSLPTSQSDATYTLTVLHP